MDLKPNTYIATLTLDENGYFSFSPDCTLRVQVRGPDGYNTQPAADYAKRILSQQLERGQL